MLALGLLHDAAREFAVLQALGFAAPLTRGLGHMEGTAWL
jgi:hypothetical protein